MPALSAVGPRRAVGKDAAVEVAVDRGPDTPPQVAMGALEALLVELEEALEMVGQGAVEHRPLRPAVAVEPGAIRCACSLHSEERRRHPHRGPGMRRTTSRAATTRGDLGKASELAGRHGGAIQVLVTDIGFAYYVSRTGVTGKRARLPRELQREVKRVRRRVPLPSRRS